MLIAGAVIVTKVSYHQVGYSLGNAKYTEPAFFQAIEQEYYCRDEACPSVVTENIVYSLRQFMKIIGFLFGYHAVGTLFTIGHWAYIRRRVRREAAARALESQQGQEGLRRSSALLPPPAVVDSDELARMCYEIINNQEKKF